MDDLDSMRPLDPDDVDFPVALDAMRNAKATTMAKSGSQEYWLVDRTATDPVDMVAVVDLASIGRIAKGSQDWDEKAKSLTIHPTYDSHAAQDVLESLIHRVRKLRKEAEASGPRP